MPHQNRIAVFLALAALVCTVTAGLIRRRAQPQVRTVSVMTLTPTAVSNQISCRGRLEYGLEYNVSVSRPSRIVAVQTQVGNRVGRGDALFSLLPIFDSDTSDGPDLQEELVAAVSGLLGSTAERGRPAIMPLNAGGLQTVRSPAAGLITQVSAAASQTVPAGRTLLTLADPESLQVRASVPEAYIQDLDTGLDCTIRGEAFRDRVYRGTVIQIMPCAYQNGTLGGTGDTVVDVIVGIETPDDALRAGFTAQLEIHAPLRDGMLMVPYEAVMQDESDTEYVFVYEDGYVSRRDVVTGFEMQDSVQILEGCREGERILLSPDGVREGERILAAEVSA